LIKKEKKRRRIEKINSILKKKNIKIEENDKRLYEIGDISEDESSKEYVFDKSSASCYFDDIESIAIGGVTSRFWMFRKHMN